VSGVTSRFRGDVTRSPDTIITTAMMPISIMLLFVYVFDPRRGRGCRAGD
jgi:ABC-2 type transport system permease protein